jgi:signal transduction histidine kinase
MSLSLEKSRLAVWLAAIALASLPALWGIGRARTKRAIAIELGIAVALLLAAQILLLGPQPSWLVVVCVPFVIVAAAALGPTHAFLFADAIVLGWAAAAGLAAGGLIPGASLPHGPARTLLDLAVTAAFLNVVAVTSTWAIGASDESRSEHLAQIAGERDELSREIEAAQPLAAAGRLVANVAHEVSNPLQAMDHFLFVLLEETPEEDPRHERLVFLKQGIDRIAQYVGQLSDFYRPPTDDDPADVNRVVGDVTRFLERQLRNANVKLTQELSPDLPHVAVSESPLRQAILNVILNAVEAMPEGGELNLSTGPYPGGVMVSIRDSGQGIAPDDLKRIFEPFFSRKRDQGGTGLGLPITQRILRSRGGEVLVESGLGSGTLVTLRIPSASG